MTRASSAMVTAIVPALLGCGDTNRNVHTDVGELCLTVAADNTIEATVNFGCIAGGCTRVVSRECAIALNADRLVVNAEAVTETENGDRRCTLECRMPWAECSLPGAPAGTYTVQYGEHATALTVPAASSDPVCVGRW